MTKNGRRYQFVEHLDHIVELFRAVDDEGSKQFEISGDAAEIRVLQEYMKMIRRRLNPDSGAVVLQEMGLNDGF